jgi:hypothetical protein
MNTKEIWDKVARLYFSKQEILTKWNFAEAVLPKSEFDFLRENTLLEAYKESKWSKHSGNSALNNE